MSIAITGSTITYDNIEKAILLYIKRYCKNIGVIRNDIPVHFNKTHRFMYSLGFENKQVNGKKNQDLPLILGTYCLTLSYDSKQNQRLKNVPEKTVEKNIEQLFLKNGLNKNKNIAKIEDLLRLIQIVLKFFSKKILRVYFPLTNNYAYFYDGLSKESEDVAYTIAPINISNSDNITILLKQFYTNLIGLDDSTNKNNANLFYSLLYKIDLKDITNEYYKVDKNDNTNDVINKTKLAKPELQINIT